MDLQEKQLETMTLGEIAIKIPSATAVFRRFDLDFCCAGNRIFTDAVAAQGLDGTIVMTALQDAAAHEDEPSFSIPESAEDFQALTGFIVERFHNKHREQFPELILLAQRVEKVHAAHELCPKGLADHLEIMFSELTHHMHKEETILFPMLCRGEREQAQGPIAMMEAEHTDHGDALRGIRQITHNRKLPDNACNTWKALYQGLIELEEDLIQHIHMENNILFAR